MALARRCTAIVQARWFAVTVFSLILANAALLGVETYSGIVAHHQHWLRLAEHACLAAFTVEILLRLAAHADRPGEFFKDPWNLFDLAVVLCAFLPVVRENTTVLRLLRLARVLRTARFLPQLRIVLVAVARSLPGTLSFLLVGVLMLYVYAMVGWVFFGSHDPEHYGSIGRAVLTLFLLMTLDGIGDAVHAASTSPAGASSATAPTYSSPPSSSSTSSSASSSPPSTRPARSACSWAMPVSRMQTEGAWGPAGSMRWASPSARSARKVRSTA